MVIKLRKAITDKAKLYLWESVLITKLKGAIGASGVCGYCLKELLKSE